MKIAGQKSPRDFKGQAIAQTKQRTVKGGTNSSPDPSGTTDFIITEDVMDS